MTMSVKRAFAGIMRVQLDQETRTKAKNFWRQPSRPWQKPLTLRGLGLTLVRYGLVTIPLFLLTRGGPPDFHFEGSN